MPLDSFRYPIEYLTIEMLTTYLVVAKQFSEQTSILCPDYSIIAVAHGLYHLSSRAPSLALSRVLLSTRSLFETNALQESTVRNAACANPVRAVDRERSVSSDSETLAQSNPERQARIHHDTVAAASSAVDMTPSIHVSDDRWNMYLHRKHRF